MGLKISCWPLIYSAATVVSKSDRWRLVNFVQLESYPMPLLSISIVHISWLVLVLGLESLHFLLRGSLEGSNVRDATLCNSLSMAIYLTTEYVELLEGISTKPTTEQVIAASKKKVIYTVYSPELIQWTVKPIILLSRLIMLVGLWSSI